MAKQKGLGMGLDALIPADLIETEFDPTAKTEGSATGGNGPQIAEITPDNIEPNPHQPRTNFDEAALASLASSIKLHGILQPVVVTSLGAGKYQLIAGERRLRAAKLVGLNTIPAIVRSFDEQEKLELALIENLQRQELNAIETATAYKKLVDQFNMSTTQIAEKVGKDNTTIVNSIRLLGLPLEAKRAVVEGKLSETMARTILSVKPELRLEFLAEILKHNWTVRQAEEFARGFRGTGKKEAGHARIAGSNSLTEDLGKYLNRKVSFQSTAKGGKLIIEYKSDDDLKSLVESLKD